MIFKSITRIVLLLLTLALVAGLFLGQITSDNFMVVAGMVFGYYFTKKIEGGNIQ